MFIFLFYLLFNMKLIFSTVVVQNSGLYEIKSDDIAMIFFLTIENTFDFKISVSVQNIECIEGDPYLETANYMYLIGGDMGTIDRKRVKNVTLIYPNLYLRNRVGKCTVALRFQCEDVVEVRKEIYFESNQVFTRVKTEDQTNLNTCDSGGIEDCSPIDCSIKYSSRRSFFNKAHKMCQPVPECPPNTIYMPISNTCRKLLEPVCTSDLKMIEEGEVETYHPVSSLINFCCHHGTINNRTGDCICDEGWTTSTCSEGVYHPTLNVYHMCNIELNSWEKANREKLIMTIIALVILAIAIAAKMLLAVCLLNWCCHFIRSKNGSETDEYCESLTCPYNYCGDEACAAGKDVALNRSSRTIRVSFSNIDAISSANDTDVTVSVDEQDKDSKPSQNQSIHLCHCK